MLIISAGAICDFIETGKVVVSNAYEYTGRLNNNNPIDELSGVSSVLPNIVPNVVLIGSSILLSVKTDVLPS